MGDTGLEKSSFSPIKTQIHHVRGAESGALNDSITEKHPELVKLIQAWPTLPQQVKSKIMLLVQEPTTEEKEI